MHQKNTSHHLQLFIQYSVVYFCETLGNSSEFCLIVRTHGQHILLNCKEVGRKPPTFNDASIIATELLNSGYEFDQGSIVYNRFR